MTYNRVPILLLAILLSGLLMGGCGMMMGPPPGLLYSDIDSNKHFDSGTSSSPAGSWVNGKSCSHSVLFLVSWGDAGLDAALEEADIKGRPMRNVTVDHNLMNILPFYVRYCTKVSAYVPTE